MKKYFIFVCLGIFLFSSFSILESCSGEDDFKVSNVVQKLVGKKIIAYSTATGRRDLAKEKKIPLSVALKINAGDFVLTKNAAYYAYDDSTGIGEGLGGSLYDTCYLDSLGCPATIELTLDIILTDYGYNVDYTKSKIYNCELNKAKIDKIELESREIDAISDGSYTVKIYLSYINNDNNRVSYPVVLYSGIGTFIWDFDK